MIPAENCIKRPPTKVLILFLSYAYFLLSSFFSGITIYYTEYNEVI